MASSGSVTLWLNELKAGEEEALAKLHARYWPYLVSLARKKLPDSKRRQADEEDVAQEAFLAFFRSLKEGRIPRLENRNDLLSLLSIITARKASDQLERQGRIKRGGGQVQGESALQALATSSNVLGGIQHAPASGRTPEDEVILKDNYEHYLGELKNDLRDFAELFLAGYTNLETAQKLGCVERTVERKIALILNKWREMAIESADRIELP